MISFSLGPSPMVSEAPAISRDSDLVFPIGTHGWCCLLRSIDSLFLLSRSKLAVTGCSSLDLGFVPWTGLSTSFVVLFTVSLLFLVLLERLVSGRLVGSIDS